MKKRVAAGVLWFFAAWYAWSIIATVIGVSTAPGLVFGVLAGLLFAGDPINRIWATESPSTSKAQAAAPAPVEVA